MNKAFTGVVSTVETITPQLAKAYLEKNKDNRKTSRHRIGIYSRDMRSGKWTPGSPISFFDNGDLADGQHRLLAVVDMLTMPNISHHFWGLSVGSQCCNGLIGEYRLEGKAVPVVSSPLLPFFCR